MENVILEQPQQQPSANPNINFFAIANFRNQNKKFGIRLDDRRRHMYVIGKTGMGKTTLLENMVLNDIYAGHGVGLVDPHGDMAEKIIDFIPPKRINDIVYFNPADLDYPIGFNILETINPDHRHLVVSGLMGIFKKIWVDMWSSRMEYILNNTILALMDFPGTTLLGINRMLADAAYRRRVVNNTKDPVVKAFWMNEFASYNDRYQQEAVAPIQNKIGQFLSASVIRNIVAQVKSRINIREIMDNKKIFIMNLSKGRIGEDNSRLLGGMLITKLQLSAMERVDVPEEERKDFFLYVDEFQNFATESFANILSEARKYRLCLTVAHQYTEQLEEEVLSAVIGNVGSIITFRVGSTDAELLTKEFAPTFVETDLINLNKFNIYLKLMINGVASRPFSATALSPIGFPTNSTEKVIKVSRERYAVPRDNIENKIARWSGMEIINTGNDDVDLIETDENDVDVGIEKTEEKIVEKKTPVVASQTNRSATTQHINNNKTWKNNTPYKKPQFNEQKQKQNFSKPKKKEFEQGEQVLLTDPSQKGISLQSLKSVQEKIATSGNSFQNKKSFVPPISSQQPQNDIKPKPQNNSTSQPPIQVQKGRVVQLD
jgi:hypothetical protein